MANLFGHGLLPPVLQSSEDAVDQELADLLVQLGLAELPKSTIENLGRKILLDAVKAEDIPPSLADFFELVGEAWQIHPIFREPLKRRIKEKLVGFKSPITRDDGGGLRTMEVKEVEVVDHSR